MKSLPLDRILLETDAPWCGIKNTHASSKFVKTSFESVKKPESLTLTDNKCVKDRCEPCHLVQVLEVVSAVLGVSEEEVETVVNHSTNKLFFSSHSSHSSHSGERGIL